jgi:hypothetical protein
VDVRGRAGFLLTAGGSILAAGIAAYLVLGTVAARRVSVAREGWRGRLGTWEEVLERYPTVVANEDALELERLALPLGIGIAPRGREDRPSPERAQVFEARDFKRESGRYLEREFARTERRVEPPPQSVARYLEAHAHDIAAIRRLLRVAEPRWDLDLRAGQSAPVPNLLGHLDLQKVLVTDALARIAAGDHGAAHADLDAGWRLNRALRGRPEVISQLVAGGATRLQVGALRLLRDPPPMWAPRLAEHDVREAFLEAMSFEGWYWTQVADPTELTSLGGIGHRVLGGLAQPYVKYCMAQASDAFRERVERLAEIGGICDDDLKSRGVDPEPDLPRWNLARRWLPGFSEPVARMARLEIDVELTALLLDLEARRDARGGVWPALPGEPVRSKACPRDHWVYEAGPDSVTVALDRELQWPESRGAMLPTRFTLER